jgi:hypothetical protein
MHCILRCGVHTIYYSRTIGSVSTGHIILPSVDGHLSVMVSMLCPWARPNVISIVAITSLTAYSGFWWVLRTLF